MKKLLIIFLIISTSQKNINSQNHEIIGVSKLTLIADSYYNSFNYDTAAIEYFRAAEKYYSDREWFWCVKSYRLASNSFHLASRFDTAFYFVQKADSITDKEFTYINCEENYEKIEVLKCRGEIEKSLGYYQEGLENFKKALIFINDTVHDSRFADILNRIGATYINLEEYDIALKMLIKSGLLLSRSDENNRLLLAENLISLGKLHSILANYDTAIAIYQKALDICLPLKGNNHSLIADIYALTGVINEKRCQFDQAVYNQQIALEIYKNIYGEYGLEVSDCYNDIAVIYGKKGEYDKSMVYNLLALKIKTLYYSSEHMEIGKSYNNIGLTYFQLGNYYKAIEYLKKALSIKIKYSGTNSSDVAMTFNNIGKAFELTNNYIEAKESYQKSLQMNLSTFGEYHPEVARNYINIGNLYFQEKEYDQAWEYVQKSLLIRSKILGNNHTGVADCYYRLGTISLAKNQTNQALEYFLQSLNINKNNFGETSSKTAAIYWKLGNTYNSIQEFEKALTFYQKGLISITSDFNDSSEFSNPSSINQFYSDIIAQGLLISKAECQYNIYLYGKHAVKDIENSLQTYQLAFKLINAMRMEYTNENASLLLSSDTKNYYYKAVKVAHEYYKLAKKENTLETLFNFIEKSKSSTLSSFFNELNSRYLACIPEEELKYKKDLVGYISTLSTKIENERLKKNEYNSNELIHYENEKFYYSRKLDSLNSFFETTYPAYYELKYEDQKISVQDIQKSVDSNTAILSYFVGDSSLFIATITDSFFTVHEISTDHKFEDLITEYYTCIKTAENDSFIFKSQAIYNSLIKPVEKYLSGKNHLVIIPDDYLYYLPFETLINSTHITELTEENYSELNYLIKHYSVSYHQSFALWYNSKTKEKLKDPFPINNFIGFAPVFNEKTGNGEIFTTNKPALDYVGPELSNISVSRDMKNFNPLPYSEREVISIVKLFEKNNKDAVAYLYKYANESNFKYYSPSYKYVHISSHGFANDKYPILSGIAFSQPDILSDSANSAPDDGILYAGETYNLTLNADLLVLSSCESGMGKLIKGEGLQALSRGFLYAGTPNIVFSLWKVLDKPTKDLMIEFYSNILEGNSYPEALRQAKLKLIFDQNTSFPHFWSGFMLLGR